MNSFKRFTYFIILFLFTFSINAQNEKFKLEGLILDNSKLSIPYAAVGIQGTYIGTSSNEDGQFYLEVPKSNEVAILVISSIGYKTIKISVKDFMTLSDKTIVLVEDTMSLDEVSILPTIEYVKLAFKNFKKNTVSSIHELKVLNRFFFIENDKTKFFIEHYIKIKDKGLRESEVRSIEIVEGRKSADYRFFKNEASRNMYPVNFMNKMNPLRRGISIRNYTWTKTGETTYDGEDLLIIKGVNKSKANGYMDMVLYIGIDTYKIYKTTNTSKTMLYIYKKNKEGKLYLSYHNRYRRVLQDLTDKQQMILQTKKNKIKLAKKNEIVVLGIETDSKKINTNDSDIYHKEMQDVHVKYNPFFWENFNSPPATAFYKKSIKELESNFGVDIETQFKLVN